jgi:hypothetical protein
MRLWGWPLTIFFGFLTLGLLALVVWPLPSLDDCIQVSGPVSVRYVDSVSTGSRGRTGERLNFQIEGDERYYHYEEGDPRYDEVKARLRVLSDVRIWHKEPPTFIFPLYSKELWRIEVGEEVVVDYDTIAADAAWEKGAIGLTGFGFFGLITFILLLATIRATWRKPGA